MLLDELDELGESVELEILQDEMLNLRASIDKYQKKMMGVSICLLLIIISVTVVLSINNSNHEGYIPITHNNDFIPINIDKLPRLMDDSSDHANNKMTKAESNAILNKMIGSPVSNMVNHGDINNNGFHTITIMDDKFYVFPNGNVIIQGTLISDNIVDMSSSLTETRLGVLDELKKLNIPSIQLGNQHPSNLHVTIFSDPQCTACQKLESILPDNLNVTIIPIPLDQIHPKSRNIIQSIVATGKPTMAWSDHMRGANIPLYPSSTKNIYPFAKVINLAQKAGLQGTPFILSDLGYLIPSIMNADQLMLQIKAASTHE